MITEELLNDSDFQKYLEEAIREGVDTDWGYDGEDEFAETVFNSDQSLEAVLKLLRQHI